MPARVLRSGMSELTDFRRGKDDFFATDPRSPLTPEQHADFTGLVYYEEDRALRVEGVLDTDVYRDEEIPMATTTGGVQVYRRAGVVRFEVEGQKARVTLFSSPEMHELFLPFCDATSGNETYGAGRYLEVQPPDPEGRVVVDLNYAYNPNCCYDESWSCPLPPRENWLDVPIRAGERNFGRA